MATTREQLRTGAQALADMQDDGEESFVPESLWNEWITDAINELHDLVAAANADSYFETEDFTLTTSNVQALPANFGSIRGLTLNPDLANRQTIHKFNFGDRNNLGGAVTDVYFLGYPRERRYRVVSRSSLIIEPKENAAGTYRLYFVPRPTEMTADEDELDAALDPYARYIKIVVAIAALAKEESNTNDLITRRDLMRLDIAGTGGNDDNEPDSIIDVLGY